MEIKLPQKLVQFDQNNDQDIFNQLEEKISFDDINLPFPHQCFNDYNYLHNLLEIDDPQLQYLVLASGCVIEHQYFEIREGFTQIQQQEIKFGYYLRQTEEELLVMVFRSFYHKAFLAHQCKFDGFSNQCIKGNNDHILQLGSSCSTFYSDIFCGEQKFDFYETLQIFMKEYHIIAIFIAFKYYDQLIKLKQDQIYRVQIIVSSIVFLLISNWQFLALVSIMRASQQINMKTKLFQLEKLILYLTLFQIYTNSFIQLGSFNVERSIAETIIYIYVILFLLQILSIFVFKRISLVIIIYLVQYYFEYIKAMIKLNTLVDNSFKLGMVFLNILIGNLQELDILTFIQFKDSILHVLLGYKVYYFIYVYAAIVILMLLNNGHQQLKLQNKSQQYKRISYLFQCFAQIQLSFLYLPLAIILALLNKIKNYQYTIICLENFYLFWICFFYFPTDFPFFSLITGLISLLLDSNELFYYLYVEIKNIGKEIKFEDLKMAIIISDFTQLLKV
ncbi:unnamed protein product (macronuclear) [Paramecium tetraurelia]|uniref:Transmembrane protein n=1 Tax=Paramecium tetraurelia TaxID=5888 RepID=A0DST4_PARTE|nr:uncharacterized protein GSPATT00019794001 [Paramecium tetraurelia]CAK86101.1 unnamed protein product [Paramecium tetraurelia]|eukprot:XP_001453498.1 hypothetical protein (macronuclear) [Paramecium tetraurelia strain d4-2]